MARFILSAFADEASDTLEGQIAALKRNGIPCLEPRSICGNVVDKTDEELLAIGKTLAESGIKISSLGSPIGKYGIEDDFAPHYEKFLRALRACELLGTDRMRVFSFFVDKNDPRRYRDEVMRRMTAMLDEASKRGIKLCHENESNIYGQDPEQVADLLDTLPSLYGVFDAANYIMEGKSTEDGFDATAKHLEYLHVKDMRRAEKVNVPVGEGDGHYDEILKKTDAMTDRTVTLTLEPHLHFFRAFAEIDSHKFRTAKDFKSNDDAFDAAADNLKKMLCELGYHEEGQIWQK